MAEPTQKLYAYVDETGQDTGSVAFVVVAVVSDADQEPLRHELLKLEAQVKTGARKWHKCDADRSRHYLQLVLDRCAPRVTVFFGTYGKPIPYFFPMLDVLEHAITSSASSSYRARVYVDGIDRKKAAELTNALRARGVKLDMVKSRRDESEPLIRLADRWAGCIRASQAGQVPETTLLGKASAKRHVKRVQ